MRETFSYSPTAAEDAFAKGDPLARETELDRCRWNAAAALAGDDPFGPGAVLAFALQLQIAERWAGMTPAAGTARLNALIRENAEPEAAPAASPGEEDKA